MKSGLLLFPGLSYTYTMRAPRLGFNWGVEYERIADLPVDRRSINVAISCSNRQR